MTELELAEAVESLRVEVRELRELVAAPRVDRVLGIRAVAARIGCAPATLRDFQADREANPRGSERFPLSLRRYPRMRKNEAKRWTLLESELLDWFESRRPAGSSRQSRGFDGEAFR